MRLSHKVGAALDAWYLRTTSACAEKRTLGPDEKWRQRKYLRVCGEETMAAV